MWSQEEASTAVTYSTLLTRSLNDCTFNTQFSKGSWSDFAQVNLLVSCRIKILISLMIPQ